MVIENPADVGTRPDSRSTGWPDNEITASLYSLVKQAIQQAKGLEDHFHTEEVWCGISADQSGNDWALPQGLNPYVAATGNAVFGAVIKVMGTDDSPFLPGNTKYDVHRILIVDEENAGPWIVRFIWGSGTANDAEIANQWTEVMVQANIAGPPVRANGLPVDMRMARIRAGIDKLWCRVKNAIDGDEIDFFIGIHEYDDPL